MPAIILIAGVAVGMFFLGQGTRESASQGVEEGRSEGYSQGSLDGFIDGLGCC